MTASLLVFSPALQDLEPQQLLLFVQSFGIPVSSMSKLLQYLDQAVSHDPQTLEQNIMDKRRLHLQMLFFLVLLNIFITDLTVFLLHRLHGSLG